MKIRRAVQHQRRQPSVPPRTAAELPKLVTRVIQNSTHFTPRYAFRHFRERFPQSVRASFPLRIHITPPIRRGDYSVADAPERRPKRKPAATRRPARNAISGHPTNRAPASPATILRRVPSPFPPALGPAAPPATSASATARAPPPAANQNSSAAPTAPAPSTG